MEPDLKSTQEESQKLTVALSQQRSLVSDLRDQLTQHEEKVKVIIWSTIYIILQMSKEIFKNFDILLLFYLKKGFGVKDQTQFSHNL